MTAPCACAARSRPTRSRWSSAASSATWPSRASVLSSPVATTTRALLRGLLQLERIAEFEQVIRELAGAPPIAGELMGAQRVRLFHDHVLVKEAGHAAAHAVAPGPAVLQRRRHADVQRVDPGRSGAARVDARVRRRLAPRPVADAAHVHGRRGEVVPGGHARGSARHRGRPRRLRDPRLGARAGRRRVLQHADAARRRRRDRRRRRAFSVRFLGDDVTHAPRRWKTSPEFPGLADELAGRRRRWITRCSRSSGSARADQLPERLLRGPGRTERVGRSEPRVPAWASSVSPSSRNSAAALLRTDLGARLGTCASARTNHKAGARSHPGPGEDRRALTSCATNRTIAFLEGNFGQSPPDETGTRLSHDVCVAGRRDAGCGCRCSDAG